MATVDADGDESPRSRELSPTLEVEDTGDIRNTSGGSETAESNGAGPISCFIATAEPAEASFFVTDWPVSSLFGFMALIGLLWLGRKKRQD